MSNKYSWFVNWIDVFGDNTTLTQIQSMNFSFGRVTQLEPIQSRGGTITVNRPFNLLSWPSVGDDIYISFNSPRENVFGGKVTDVEVSYGIVSNEDILTITFADPMGEFGRRQLVNESISQGLTTTQWQTLFGTGYTATFGTTNSIAQGTTFTGSALDYANKLMLTEGGRVSIERDGTPSVWRPLFYTKTYLMPQATQGFTDASSLLVNQLRYDNVKFASFANAALSRVVVNAEGLAAQTAGTGTRGIIIETIDATTTQAADNAQYILTKYSNTGPQPVEISCTDQQQSYDAIRLLMNKPIGRKETVTFRGKTYNVVIEGFTVSVNPQQARFTFNLSGQDQNPYLILDDAVYGKLDTNKLGF